MTNSNISSIDPNAKIIIAGNNSNIISTGKNSNVLLIVNGAIGITGSTGTTGSTGSFCGLQPFSSATCFNATATTADANGCVPCNLLPGSTVTCPGSNGGIATVDSNGRVTCGSGFCTDPQFSFVFVSYLIIFDVKIRSLRNGQLIPLGLQGGIKLCDDFGSFDITISRNTRPSPNSECYGVTDAVGNVIINLNPIHPLIITPAQFKEITPTLFTARFTATVKSGIYVLKIVNCP